MKSDGWSLQVASDIVREGLGLELLSETGVVAAEIFRCDADHSLSMTLWGASVPANVLAWFRAAARRSLGDTYEDGTLIDWAQAP